ncbi:unnamed protein product [Lymnaea stagnalis]|uniref:Sfi1 spindle body domain-containing protein n=1 Tax=Lymnaea stagnalis TaxID=6523 RepID=A0AAV2HC85_LYMST
MSKVGQNTHSKKMKQDLQAELNTVLSVQAEKIRQRLNNERQAIAENIEIAVPQVKGISHEMVSGIFVMDSSSHNPVAGLSLTPISKARQRRRLKIKTALPHRQTQSTHKTKTAYEGQTRYFQGSSTVNIKNYRPGYTWSMGGRIKELRIRCIARKHIYIWRKKVFGRVPLALAQQHHEMRLMQKAFNEWYDFWWEIVKEWRLSVRAECHYRYKLGVQMFLKWKAFIASRRFSNAKVASASNYYNRHLQKKVWEEWKSYIKHRHIKQQMKKKSDEFNSTNLTRKTWKIWKDRHSKHIAQKEDITTALQFWSYRIQAHHWLIWKAAFIERQQQQKRYLDATIYHNTVVVTKFLQNWKQFLEHRRAKKKQIGFVRAVYHGKLQERYFNHWCQRWHLMRSLQQHHLKIESLSHTFRCRWVVWRWIQFVGINREMRVKEKLADNHFHHQLLRIGVDAFRLNVVHSHIKVMRTQLSHQIRVVQLQRGAWGMWKSAFEEREELKILPQTELAKEHFNTTVTRKCFLALIDYTQWRQHRKKQYAQADAHFYLRIVPVCFYHMHLFVELEKTCRENSVKAVAFRRHNMELKIFKTWVTAANQSRDDRMMDRMALLHRESVILQRSFTLWKERTEDKAQEIKKMSQVKEQYLWSLCYKAFCAWKKLVADEKLLVLHVKKASQHHYLKTLHKSMEQWKKWVNERKIKKAQIQKAANHLKFKVLKKCMSTWKVFAIQGRKFKLLADERYKKSCSKLLSETILKWRKVSSNLALQRKKENAAHVYHNRVLLLRVLQEWHHYSSIHAYKRSQTNQLLNEAKEHLQKFKLMVYMKHWIHAHKAMSSSQQHLQLALAHFNKKLLVKAMLAWKLYCRMFIRNQLMTRQCRWFHDVRVTAKHFLIWKERLSVKSEEMGKTQLALWQWSLVLQRKVLVAWQVYIVQRKHKKSRLAEAAFLWRQNLLRKACVQWLATADSLSHMRSVMAVRHQAKSVFDSFQLVQRCGLHWKVWAKRRASNQRTLAIREKSTTAIANGQLEKNPNQFPITSHIYPRSNDHQAYCGKLVLIPEPAVSPVRPPNTERFQGHLGNFVKSKQRPKPKRPSFLVDSLKRAGLCMDAQESRDLEVCGMSDVHASRNQFHDIALHQEHIDENGSDVSISSLGPRSKLVHEEESSKDPFFTISHTKSLKLGPRFSSLPISNSITEQGPSDYQKDLRLSGHTHTQGPENILLEQTVKIQQESSVQVTPIQLTPIVLLKPEDFMTKPACPSKPNEILDLRNELIVRYEPTALQDNVHDVVDFLSKLSDTSHTESLSSLDSEKENVMPHKTKLCNQKVRDVDGDLSSLGRASENLLFVSNNYSSPEEEIFSIRDRLKHFHQQKQKLRALRKQHKQLSHWLRDQEHLGNKEDEDCKNAVQELEMLKLERTELHSVIESQRPACEILVQQAQTLAKKFHHL